MVTDVNDRLWSRPAWQVHGSVDPMSAVQTVLLALRLLPLVQLG